MNITDEKIDEYCKQHSSAPSKVVKELEDYTILNHHLSHMVTGDLIASYLNFHIKISNTKSILEIGTFTGYSALAMAEALPEDGKIITLDKNKRINKIASEFWNKSIHGKKIEARFGDAKILIEEIEEKFDLVFIDADKRGYITYLTKALDLLTPNGCIIVDNVLWRGDVALQPSPDEDKSAQPLRDFNDFVANDPTLLKVMLPIRDGLYLIKKL